MVFPIMIKKIVFIGCAFLLMSCAVKFEEYYYPKAEGTEVEKQFCRGKVGADNKLVHSTDGVRTILSVWESKGLIWISISFEVFDEANVVWPKQNVNVYADGGKVELDVKSFSRLRFLNKYQSSDLLEKEYFIGSRMNNTAAELFESYSKTFLVSENKIERVAIDKIKLVINDKNYYLSDLLFEKKSGIFLHPLNC